MIDLKVLGSNLEQIRPRGILGESRRVPERSERNAGRSTESHRQWVTDGLDYFKYIENGSEKQGFGDKRTGSLLMRRTAAVFEKTDGTGRPSSCAM